jgi:integrase
MDFLKSTGDKTTGQPKKFIDKDPTIYGKGEVEALLAQAEKDGDVRLRVMIDLARMIGLREQELMYAEFSAIDFATCRFAVRGNPKYGFVIKNRKEQTVDMPAKLCASLKAWHEQNPGKNLILGTANDTPDGHMLRALKRLAKRAGLNCGKCVIKGTGPNAGKTCTDPEMECKQWGLHKLRRHYITTLLRNQVDLRTVQQQARHSNKDLKSTLRYLRATESKELQVKLNAIDW